MVIRFLEGGEELLEKVGPLWKRLNEHHQNISIHFFQQLQQVTFAQRQEHWLNEMKSGQLRIDLAQTEVSNEFVGYCVTICNQNHGEIESIFVDDTYQKMGIGHCLMTRALDWLDRQSVKTKGVSVAVGNEKVFQFYKKFGFLPRATTLEQRLTRQERRVRSEV